MAYCDNGFSKVGLIRTLHEQLKSELCEKDINWLIEEKLFETVKIATQIHFQSLKNKYQIIVRVIFPLVFIIFGMS
jgi:hypothetical protein